MMDTIMFSPLEKGRPVIKSKAMRDHGRAGMERGWRRLAQDWVDYLLRLQT